LYDGEVDIPYVSLRRSQAYDSEELGPDVRAEYDEKGKLIGIDAMNVRTSAFKAIANEIATQRNDNNKNINTSDQTKCIQGYGYKLICQKVSAARGSPISFNKN